MSDFQHYYDNLAGKKVEFHDGDAQYGFYRTKDGMPVAIWKDNGGLHATVNGSEADPMEIWTWVCQKPVTYDDFKHRSDTGLWPNEPEPTGMGHNNPPVGYAAFKAEIEEAAKAAIASIENGIHDQKAADLAANHREKLMQLGKDAEKLRVEEKKPHDDAGKTVQAKWLPLLDQAKSAMVAVRSAITVYLNAEEKKQREAEAEAAKEAAERAAKAQAANEPPPEPEPEKPAPAPIHAGTRGRATSLRTVKRAEITDYDKALAHFANNEEVKVLIQKLANAAARSGVEVPGTNLIEERMAA